MGIFLVLTETFRTRRWYVFRKSARPDPDRARFGSNAEGESVGRLIAMPLLDEPKGKLQTANYLAIRWRGHKCRRGMNS